MPKSFPPMLSVAALGGLLCGVGARAAEGNSGQPQVVEEAEPAAKVNYAKGHVWMGTGLSVDIVDVSSDRQGRLLALAADGSVYRKTDTQSWRAVMGPTVTRFGDGGIDEEELLLDAESILDEISDLTDDDRDRESDESDDDDTDVAESDEVVDDPGDGNNVDGDLTDVLAGSEPSDDPSSALNDKGAIWISTETAGVALMTRSDGVWRSIDGGVIWKPVLGLSQVHRFSDGPNGVVLAGTRSGVRFSVDDGATWSSNADPICRIETFDFAMGTDHVFAGTSEGLFRSNDGLKWAKLLSRYDTDVPVWSVEIDRFWDGGLWVSGPVGILRSDDGGEQLRAAGRNMLPGTRSLLALDSPGHILAAGMDGVWESRDGGMRWRPIANGLPSSDNSQLAYGPSGPVVGGRDGVHALTVVKEKTVQADQERVQIPEGADMGTVTKVALNRPGMAIGEVLTSGSIARSLLLPKLTIQSNWNQSRMLAADHVARSNKGHYRNSWDIGFSACFGGCSSSAGFSNYADDVSFDTSSGSSQVAVVGNEVYDIAGEGSLAPMAANVAERVTRYRTDVANRVSELVLARHRLLEAGQVVSSLSLREQVAHDLDVQESVARIDVYTNGYFSRVLEGS